MLSRLRGDAGPIAMRDVRIEKRAARRIAAVISVRATDGRGAASPRRAQGAASENPYGCEWIVGLKYFWDGCYLREA
jgi:hypothetical protein